MTTLPLCLFRFTSLPRFLYLSRLTPTLCSPQEHGVEVAIQAIYRDLEYAKTLVKARIAHASSGNNSSTALGAGGGDDGPDTEESWTFIGDDSDPELIKKLQTWDPVGKPRGRVPKVSLERKGFGVIQTLEPVVGNEKEKEKEKDKEKRKSLKGK